MIAKQQCASPLRNIFRTGNTQPVKGVTECKDQKTEHEIRQQPHRENRNQKHQHTESGKKHPEGDLRHHFRNAGEQRRQSPDLPSAKRTRYTKQHRDGTDGKCRSVHQSDRNSADLGFQPLQYKGAERNDQQSAGKSGKPGSMKIGVDTLPSLPRDATDRNRTSPFAFTGNKFEFRAPGSSQSCSGVNMMLNTIMAESLDFFSEQLEKFTEKNFNEKLQKLLKKVYSAHKRVIFNGDNYSQAWAKEAEKRGLVNLNNTLDALKPLKYDVNKKLMAHYGVLSEEEMDSRYEVFLEEYHRKIRIEGEVGLEMARSTILPAVSIELGSAVSTLNALGNRPGQKAMERSVNALGEGLDRLSDSCISLETALAKDDSAAIISALGQVRSAADMLESVLDDKAWPLPKYREILFVY